MKHDHKHSYYYAGGLAEFTSNPTPLTYSFFIYWFTGRESLGKAMALLQLPYQNITLPILEMVDLELVVNLQSEEKTLYEKTIFHYKEQQSLHHVPTLTVSFPKLFSLINVINTIKITSVQTQWLVNPNTLIKKANSFLSEIPDGISDQSILSLDTKLKDVVWPRVIAIGLLNEFISQALQQDINKTPEINNYIAEKIAKHDWFFLSLNDQAKIKNREMSFDEYLKLYGARADNDYELSSPRWHEIPDLLKKRIKDSQIKNIQTNTVLPRISERLRQLVEASIKLHILRSEAKRKTLVFIDALRQTILKEFPKKNIQTLTRSKLLGIRELESISKSTPHQQISSAVTLGTGLPVSSGQVKGTIQFVKNVDEKINEGAIVIFPNASPEFSIMYPKCHGMIFLKGGQTSHGSIVAREYKIPALIDPLANGIPAGSNVQIDGQTGSWKVLSPSAL